MQKSRCLSLSLLALLVLATGCQSARTGRAKPRFQEDSGTFADLATRNSFIDQRVTELTHKGMTRSEAATRASREWFAQAPVVSQSPTPYELKRRASQADITAYLDRQRESNDR